MSEAHEYIQSVPPFDFHWAIRDRLANTAEGSLTDIAESFVREMRLTHPVEWEKFMWGVEVEHIRRLMHQTQASNRQDAFKAHIADVTNQRATQIAAGTPKVDLIQYGVASGRFKRLKKMTKTEVLSTADHLNRVGRGALHQACLLKAIASRMERENTTVEEAYSDEQLVAMFGEECVDI